MFRDGDPAGEGRRGYSNAVKFTERGLPMFTRIALVAGFSVIVVAGCAERPKPKDTSRQEAPVCKGLAEAQCNTNSQCLWSAEKAKCKKVESGETLPQDAAPEWKDTKDPNR